MGFIGNQIINMMMTKIRQNNPKMGKYLDEIQRGGNDITKSQFNTAKPLLQRYGGQIGINIQESDLRSLESLFDSNNNNYYQQRNNNGGFRF